MNCRVGLFASDSMKNIYVIISLLLIVGICLTGCSVKKEHINSKYLERFDFTIEQMRDKKYSQAEEGFLALIEELEQDPVQADEIFELRADIEYAIGSLYLEEGSYNAAYDYYISAYTYYKSEIGEDSGKTIETRLRLAEIENTYLNRKEHALSEFLEVYEKATVLEYKNIALCNAVSAYMGTDCGQKTDYYIGIVRNIVDTVPTNSAGMLEPLIEEDTFAEVLCNAVPGRYTQIDQYWYAYEILGSYYIVYNEPDEAIKMYKSALSLLENAGADESLKISFYSSLGFVYLYFKGEAESNEYLDRAVEIADRVYPIGVEKAGLYITVAEKYLAIGDYNKFGTYLEDSVAMVKATAGENHSIVALSKDLLSEYYQKIGAYQQAIVCCEESIEIRKNILREDSADIGAAYNTLANRYSQCGYNDKAIEAYLKAIEIYKEFNDDLQLAVVNRNIALIYNNSFGDHNLALQYAREAISLVEPMDELYYGGTIAAIYMVMADILTYSDYEYQLIEEYSEKAYNHLQSAVGNIDEELANYHLNLGEYLSDNNRYPEALTHLLSAECLFENVYKEMELYPIDIFFDIANCYYYTGFLDKALDYFEHSIDYCKMHIALLNEQGDYNTCYWDSTRDESGEYIERIKIRQQDETKNVFGGKYLDGRDELYFYDEGLDGDIEFAWSHLYETGPISGFREGDTITFCHYKNGERVISGNIHLSDDAAVLTITYSNIDYVDDGVKHFTFFSDDDLAEQTLATLLKNSESKVWLRNYPASWQSKAYLHFFDDGKICIWTETEDGSYIEEEESFIVKSENRICIGEIEYSITFYDGGMSILPIHSDEYQLSGAYDLLEKDDQLQILSS